MISTSYGGRKDIVSPSPSARLNVKVSLYKLPRGGFEFCLRPVERSWPGRAPKAFNYLAYSHTSCLAPLLQRPNARHHSLAPLLMMKAGVSRVGCRSL